uniref:Activated leukocyte cell adhesion molecule b n=1 Tax=Nothobranchius korthausae TaxID=1143690 RepID=A0A1A8F340_9TELE
MHLLSALLAASLLCKVAGLDRVTGLYGQTLEIPCNNGAVKMEDILLVKWKYDKGQGQYGDLMVLNKGHDAVVSATADYKNRVSMAKNFSLLLSGAKLSDQKTFTCMVAGTDITEYPLAVVIHKPPAGVGISDIAEALEIGKLKKLGDCVARDANPAASITWLRNNEPLADGKGISIKSSVLVDPDTGLSTTMSILEYSALKSDAGAQFTCSTQHPLGEKLVSSPVNFTITYSTEHITLRVNPESPAEGDNVTLTCEADGNPAPTSFNFYIKGEVVKAENANKHILTHVSRNATGLYKCSLIDNPLMESSRNITVNYLDINLSPSGKIVKHAGKALNITLQIDSSEKSAVSWTKEGVKLHKEPKFANLTYSDSGVYECEVTLKTLRRKASFHLVVQGAPVIKYLKKMDAKGQQIVLICEAEGSPKPVVSWSINGTVLNETSHPNGKITHKITVTPSADMTVTCTVSNEFGMMTQDLNVSSVFEEVKIDKQDPSGKNDKTQMVVGVVVGLLIAALVIGLAYWLYVKKSKQGSWKTGEKENGNSEEEKKLEEKGEENSQKAEV